MPRFQGANFEHNKTVIQHFIDFAKTKNIQPGQLALAWLLAQGEQVVPIPGMKTRKHLDDNFASDQFQITEHDQAELNQIFDQIRGARYPEANKKFLE